MRERERNKMDELRRFDHDCRDYLKKIKRLKLWKLTQLIRQILNQNNMLSKDFGLDCKFV